MAQPRCPVCGCIGSEALGDYCKNHHPNADDDDKHLWEGFPTSFDGKFFPDDFKIEKDKFGYER